ncbi:MAG TPA: hypothetical protein VHW23_11980 [Kofleriaceae bacterium]|jgi:hypothetical protein|nr:hypothetical protein [Kofleriaceae bacterium]
MARRNPLPRLPRGPRAPRPGAAAIGAALGVVFAGAMAGTIAGTIAPGVGWAEPAPDLERARELYRSAETAMQDGRYDDAARDYGAAYEVSGDPALFYKIGRANERAGKCDVAVVYYARYLREGKPSEQFTALTRERIAACGGDRPDAAGAGSGSAQAGDAAGGAANRAAGGGDHAGAGAARAAASTTGPGAGTGSSSAPGPTTREATASPAPAPGAASPEPGASSGSAAALIPPTREKVAYLLGGGALALITLGGVLSYAASSSENDIRDLYAGFAGQVPPFDAPTRKRYDDLVDEGRRYQHLAWAAFGLAGAAAVGVAVLFAVGRGDESAPPRPALVSPIIGPRGAGVSVRF